MTGMEAIGIAILFILCCIYGLAQASWGIIDLILTILAIFIPSGLILNAFFTVVDAIKSPETISDDTGNFIGSLITGGVGVLILLVIFKP